MTFLKEDVLNRVFFRAQCIFNCKFLGRMFLFPIRKHILWYCWPSKPDIFQKSPKIITHDQETFLLFFFSKLMSNFFSLLNRSY